MKKETTSDLRSGIKKLISLYATGFKHLSGKEIKVKYGSGCCANLDTFSIELPDVVGYKNEKEKEFKERLLRFGARHEFGHLIATDIKHIREWYKKVHGSRAVKFLHQCMNVFEDIREEHIFCGHFPGASEEMMEFTQYYINYDLKSRLSDPSVPITKKLMDLCYLRGRSIHYSRYGLGELKIKVPSDVEDSYQKIAADLVARAVDTEDQEVINQIAYEFYERVKEESEKTVMPPLNVGDVVGKGGEYGQVISIDPSSGDVEVEVIDKAEAKRRLAS